MLTCVVVEEMPEHDVDPTFVNLRRSRSHVGHHVRVTWGERSGSARYPQWGLSFDGQNVPREIAGVVADAF
jgi:hypothetical protein